MIDFNTGESSKPPHHNPKADMGICMNHELKDGKCTHCPYRVPTEDGQTAPDELAFGISPVRLSSPTQIEVDDKARLLRAVQDNPKADCALCTIPGCNKADLCKGSRMTNMNNWPPQNEQETDGQTETPRTCTNCNHLESEHKWYAQSEDYDGEERWECRHDDCDCIVTWLTHEFIEVGQTETDELQRTIESLLYNTTPKSKFYKTRADAAKDIMREVRRYSHNQTEQTLERLLKRKSKVLTMDGTFWLVAVDAVHIDAELQRLRKAQSGE